MKSIIFNNVSYSYDQQEYAIKNLSLEIEQGSYVTLVGHNGSGKSTLTKLLIGLLPLSEGEIIVNGLKLEKENLREIRKQISIVFQNPDNQFIGSTVEDDIAFGLENRQIEQAKMYPLIKEYATKVGMVDYLSKEPTNLSGGQKQRVAIAGALVLAPKILVLDEATSMLDPKGKREILELIRKMREKMPDLTIISITHDIEETVFADKIVVLNKGEVKAIGNPKEVLENSDLINECGITKPFIYLLKDAFAKKGIDIKNATTLEEVSKILCQYK